MGATWALTVEEFLKFNSYFCCALTPCLWPLCFAVGVASDKSTGFTIYIQRHFIDAASFTANQQVHCMTIFHSMPFSTFHHPLLYPQSPLLQHVLTAGDFKRSSFFFFERSMNVLLTKPRLYTLYTPAHLRHILPCPSQRIATLLEQHGTSAQAAVLHPPFVYPVSSGSIGLSSPMPSSLAKARRKMAKASALQIEHNQKLCFPYSTVFGNLLIRKCRNRRTT